MSMKLFACLLAAALVTTGGAYYYHGSSGCGSCPFSGSSPKSVATDDANTCPSDAKACCLTESASAPAPSCCEMAVCEAKPADACTASVGGAITAAKGLK